MRNSMAAAQDASETSVIVSSPSPNPNWWEIHENPVVSWNYMNRPSWATSSNQLLKISNNSSTFSSDQEDMSNISTTSFINSADSNHSGLTMDSSATDLTGEPVDNNLWSQLLLRGGEMHNEGENFLDLLSSKSLTSEMFDPAPCDYSKKLDNSWEFNNQQTSINNCLISRGLPDQSRPMINNQSDPVSNWSIAPPNPQHDHQFTSINQSTSQYAVPNISQMKHGFPTSPSTYTSNVFVGEQAGSGGPYMSYLHDMKLENQQQELELGLTASLPSFLRPLSSSNNPTAYQTGLSNSSQAGTMNKYCNGMAADLPWTRNLTDLISFNSAFNKPSMDHLVANKNKTPLKGPAELVDNKKQAYETSQSSGIRGSGVRSPRTSSADGNNKKKRTEDSSETVSKKAKNESSSTVSCNKLQVPKVKFSEKITALQQIVSPFGKTDTASVLFEAIKYIQFLQEQVQLLSDPYMKSGKKDHNPWAGLERKELKSEQNQDLRSSGLCLVPLAYTPQACRENSGPDFWTPTYRGCVFR